MSDNKNSKKIWIIEIAVGVIACLIPVAVILIFVSMKPDPGQNQFGVVKGIPTMTPPLTKAPEPTVIPTPSTVPFELDPLSLEWWTDCECNNRTILDTDYISRLNEAIFFSPETGVHRPDQFEGITGDELKALIESKSVPDGYTNFPTRVSEEEKKNIIDNCNLTMKGKEKVEVRYAITSYDVVRSDGNAPLYTHPYSEEIYEEWNSLENDNLLFVARLHWGEPVVVLWESLDKEWLYVQSLNYTGWVMTTGMGFCDKTFFDDYCRFYFDDAEMKYANQVGPYPFDRVSLMRTNPVVINNDAGNSFGWVEGMQSIVREGTIFPRSLKNEFAIVYLKYESAIDTFYVPVRDNNGDCLFTIGFTEFQAVSHPFVSWERYEEPYNELLMKWEVYPCTDRSICEQIGRHLEAPVSRGGREEFFLDDVLLVDAIYRDFGLFLPATIEGLKNLPCSVFDVTDYDFTHKKELLKTMPLGTILLTKDRAMIYLGEDQGELYAVVGDLWQDEDITYADCESFEISSLYCLSGDLTYFDQVTTIIDLSGHIDDIANVNDINWWIKKECTNDGLSSEKTALLNEAAFKAENAGMHRPDRLGQITGDELKKLIESAKFPSKDYINGEKISENSRKNSILSNRNLTMKGNKPIEIRYAITTESNAALRCFPTFDRISDESGQFNYFQETGVYLGEPLAVLWKSQDEKWAYVITLNYSGWMLTNSFGYCDKELFDDYCSLYFDTKTMKHPEKVGEYGFERVVSQNCDEVYVFASKTKPSATTFGIRMGSVLLKLTDEAEEECKKYRGELYNGFFYIPNRDANGNVVFKEATTDDLECRSEIELTDRNLLINAGKLLKTEYSWGDETLYGMDCSSTMVAVFRSLGLFLPRNTADMLKYPAGVKDISKLDNEAKKSYIMEQSAGTLLFFPGHVMMYLGEHDGKLYVLHNTNKVTYEDGTEKEVMSCVITTLDCLNGKQTYLEKLTTSLDLMGKAAE